MVKMNLCCYFEIQQVNFSFYCIVQVCTIEHNKILHKVLQFFLSVRAGPLQTFQEYVSVFFFMTFTYLALIFRLDWKGRG
jgi:hypothetical protein